MTALREMLERQGYEAVGFASANEALAELKERDFDVLITDLMMPEMDGIALLEAALGIDPHLVGIVMTGQATVQTAVDAMKVGAFDYVMKPFKLSALAPVIARAMEVRRLRLENLELRETVAIYELAKAVAFTPDLNSILNKVADAAKEQCNADEVSILLPTPSADELYVAVARGENRNHLIGQRAPVEKCLAGWVARNREPLRLDGEVNDPRFEVMRRREDLNAAVLVPMLAGGRLVGVLNVSATHPRRPFTLGQVKALSILAGSGAAALQNAIVHGELRELNAGLERRVAERTAQLEAANKELEAFAYSVSHDLRAPLRGMDGFSNALLEDYGDKLDEQGRDYLIRVRAATQRMGQLIDDLLKLSRVTQSGVRRGRADLTALAEAVATELRESQPERQVEFIIEPRMVADADSHMLRIVLDNLIGNAWKFTAKRARATIQVGLRRNEYGAIYFVRDDGAGFDMIHAGKLFGAFQRLHSSAEFDGSGIGLATVQRIIHRHGGRVWAEGAVDAGATFHFTLDPFPNNAMNNNDELAVRGVDAV